MSLEMNAYKRGLFWSWMDISDIL